LVVQNNGDFEETSKIASSMEEAFGVCRQEYASETKKVDSLIFLRLVVLSVTQVILHLKVIK